MKVFELVDGYRELRAQGAAIPTARFLARLAGWQIGKALSLPRTVPIHDRSRMRLQLARDDHGIRSAIYLYRDEYEPSVRSAIDRFVSPGAICFDIGANLGLWTLRMAEAAGDEGTVHAFEPHPGNVAELTTNAELSGLRSIRIHGHGLGESDERAELFVPDDVGRASLARETGSDKAVPITLRPLDAVWEELGRPEVSFVKMDVEGAEPVVLRGGRHFFATARPVICCEVNPGKLANMGFVPADVLDPFRALGYTPFLWTGSNLVDFPAGRAITEVEDFVMMPAPAREASP